jgi:hypothetical protein
MLRGPKCLDPEPATLALIHATLEDAPRGEAE